MSDEKRVCTCDDLQNERPCPRCHPASHAGWMAKHAPPDVPEEPPACTGWTTALCPVHNERHTAAEGPEEPRPRTLSLPEVLAGADRATERVKTWPQWKRDIAGAEPPDVPDPTYVIGTDVSGDRISITVVRHDTVDGISRATMVAESYRLLPSLATLRGELEETRRRLERESRMLSDALAQTRIAQQAVLDARGHASELEAKLRTDDALLERAQADRAAMLEMTRKANDKWSDALAEAERERAAHEETRRGLERDVHHAEEVVIRERAARKEAERALADFTERSNRAAELLREQLAEAERQRDEMRECHALECGARNEAENQTRRLRELWHTEVQHANKWCFKAHEAGKEVAALRERLDAAERQRDEARAQHAQECAAHDANRAIWKAEVEAASAHREAEVAALRERLDEAERQRDEAREALRVVEERARNQGDALGRLILTLGDLIDEATTPTIPLNPDLMAAYTVARVFLADTPKPATQPAPEEPTT